MTAPVAFLPVPRPKTPKNYDQRTVDQSFQSLERDLQQKFDRRGDLILDPGAELVLTADGSSAQYGIGIDVSGYIRILNYADGSIGTFSVAWAQVDGAQQEITNLTTYVDAADATLQASINTVATTSATNGTAISTLQTEITAAREGEASLLANITDVRTAFASADAAEASARTTLQANLEAADTTLQANIDAEESARVTADTAEAAARTTLTAQVRGSEAPLVKNAYLQEEFSGTVVPPEWTNWVNGFATWVTRTYGEGYGVSLAASAGLQCGFYQLISVEAGKKYLLSGEVVRTLGGSTLAGAGVLVQWMDSGSNYISQNYITFATDATTSGIVDSAPDGVNRWEKEVTAPATAVTGRVYAMNHWSTLGSVAAALTLTWRECNLVPVSNAQAQTTINAASIVAEESARVTADTAEAAARATLQANLESADTTLQANIDAEESARVTADSAEAAARTALEANLTKAAVQLTVDNFDADGFYWTRAFGGAPESVSDPVNASYSDVSGIGRVLETSAYALYLTPKAVIKPYVGRKIRVEVKVRATVDPSSGALTATLSDINGLSSAWAHGAPSFTASAVTGYNSSESGLTVSDGWVTLARIYECTALSTYDAGWRPRFDVTHTGSGGTVQVAYFKIEDVTEAQDIRASVTTEEVARIAGDAAEAAARTSLQTTLEAADSTLQSNIDAEASARTTADATAATDRTAIRSEFAAADTTLQANIDTEAGTRATADTAEAAARTTLEAEVKGQLGAGNNLLQNSTFQEFTAVGGVGEPSGWTSANTGGTYTKYVTGSGTLMGWFLPEERSFAVNQSDATSGVIHDTRTGRVYVEAGKKYEFSAYTGAHRCEVQLLLEFYNSSDVLLSNSFSDSSNNNELAGGDSLASWKRIGGVQTAPANAHYAILNMRKGGTSTGSNSWLFVTRPMIAEAQDDQTNLSAYVPSGVETRAAAVTNAASIVTESSARVTADTAEASARETLEANLQNGLTPYTVSTFNADGYHWYGGFGGAPDAVSDPGNCTYADVANVGRVLETSTFTLYLQPKAVVRPYLGMKLRCEVKIRTTSNPSGGGISGGLTLNGLTSAWGHSGVNATVSAPTGYSTSFSNLVVADGWVTIAAIMEPTSLGAGEAAWRPRLDVSRTGSGGTIQVAYFKIEDVTDIYARTEILREAFVDSNGDAYAAIRLVAAASGGTPAIIELKSGDGTSDVRLGGNTEIDGNLVVNGTIQTEGIVANGVTNAEGNSVDAATTLTANAWVTVASETITTTGGRVLINASGYTSAAATGVIYASVRVLRDAVVVRETGALPSINDLAGGHYCAGIHTVIEIDEPAAGTYTYYYQVYLNVTGATVGSIQCEDRTIYVTEFKR